VAQEIPPPAVAVTLGVSRYDLSGTGTESLVGVRLDLPMSDYLYAEPSFTYMSYRSDGGATVPHLTAEVQLQGSYPFGRWRPYLGGGAGGFFDMRKQRDGTDLAQPTISGAAGVRVDFPGNLGARAELRVRAVGRHFGASAGEWSAGVSWSF
jgi:hypothetical protein